jgi:RNA binding exosome subunit
MHATRDKEYVLNAMEEVLTSIMVNHARNAMEESGKNVMVADVRVVVQAIVIDF